jgi:hypothetical protein
MQVCNTADGCIHMHAGDVLTGVFTDTGEMFRVTWVEYRLGSALHGTPGESNSARNVLSNLRFYYLHEIWENRVLLKLTEEGLTYSDQHKIATTVNITYALLLELSDSDEEDCHNVRK